MRNEIGRRTFLEYCALGAGSQLVPSRLPRGVRWRPGSLVRGLGSMRLAGDPPDATAMLALARHGIDAALAAGASYADARLTHVLTENYDRGTRGSLVSTNPPGTFLSEDLSGSRATVINRGDGAVGIATTLMNIALNVEVGIGVRALVNGYWGFAASPYWTMDDAARLGKESAAQAVFSAGGAATKSMGPVTLGSIPVIRDGRWIMPGIDPFTIAIDEKIDFLQNLLETITEQSRYNRAALGGLGLWREERVFASSEGTALTQVRYRTQPGPLSFETRVASRDWSPSALCARGWDIMHDLNAQQMLEGAVPYAKSTMAALSSRRKPVTVGRYDVVVSSEVAGALTYQTLGWPTELDRVLGLEANATGTSYLGPDPFRSLGMAIAPTGLTLSANRTQPGALATTKWDDDGVETGEFAIVRDGVLVDYQTTREHMGIMEPWYRQRNIAVKSHGCAVASTAINAPLLLSPNFIVAPGREDIAEDDLIRDTRRGIYFPAGKVDVDHQSRNGVLVPDSMNPPREIKDGRIGDVLASAALTFNTVELWKKFLVSGGPRSATASMHHEVKGQPSQDTLCNVTAVPMKYSGMSIIDLLRRA